MIDGFMRRLLLINAGGAMRVLSETELVLVRIEVVAVEPDTGAQNGIGAAIEADVAGGLGLEAKGCVLGPCVVGHGANGCNLLPQATLAKT